MLKIVKSQPLTKMWIEPQEPLLNEHMEYRALEISRVWGGCPEWRVQEVITINCYDDKEVTFEEFMGWVGKMGEEGFFKSLREFMDAKNG